MTSNTEVLSQLHREEFLLVGLTVEFLKYNTFVTHSFHHKGVKK